MTYEGIARRIEQLDSQLNGAGYTNRERRLKAKELRLLNRYLVLPEEKRKAQEPYILKKLRFIANGCEKR